MFMDRSSSVMQRNALLTTKLYIPPAHAKLVSRSQLIERLNAGMDGKLTLISAPAGFGKTTLLSEWQASARKNALAVAWVSLDEGDNDPAKPMPPLARFFVQTPAIHSAMSFYRSQ